MSGRKLMVVEGWTVPAEIEDGIVAWILGVAGSFAAKDVIAKAHELGTPRQAVDPKYGRWGPAHRLADRILQAQRRRGHIAFRKDAWTVTTAGRRVT